MGTKKGYMTHNSLHALCSTLQAIPVAMIFSKQLELTQKTTVEATTQPDHGATESHTILATNATSSMREIPGYSHDGLNE